MHALIIEDEPLISVAIEDILMQCGFTSVDVALTIDDAIQAASVRCPDLITADVELKVGNGIDAVNQICSGPPIPVIFITGSPNQVRATMPQHPLILKPFASEEVVAAIRFVMAR